MSAVATNQQKCKVAELQPGDKLSRISYLTVRSIKSNGSVEVVNEAGNSWTIGKSIVEDECYTATQFSEEEKVSRTKLVEILQNTGDTLFEAKFKKKNGDDRPLTGRRVPGSDDTCFGRTNALESLDGRPPQKRQIDHRTLYEVTTRNKRFKLK